MLLAIFLAGAILWNLPWSKYDNVFFVSAVEPGYLDFDNLPDTNFSCDSKVIGGYYADIETGCQMFHVCTIGQKSEITDIKFLCLNGTVFDQETRVCERLDEVDCSRSESFFDLNLELYGNNGGGYGIQPEDDGKEHEAEHCEDEYEDEGETGNSCHKKAQTNGTEHKDTEYNDWEESTPAAVSQAPSTSSTTAPTTARPVLTSSSSQRPTTSPPKFLYQRPQTTADPSLQLLALHESFQQKQQDASKLRPINVAPAPAKNSSTAFSFSKTPLPYPTFPSSGPPSAPSAKPSFYPPLPSKLPNTLSNLSQKPSSSSFANSQANSNRTPPGSSAQPFFKPEPASYFGGGNSNKHSQKVTLPPQLPAGVSVQKQPEPVLFTYNRFRPSNTIQYNFATNPVSDSSAFKMETPSALAHPTFVAIAQSRPFTFRPQPTQFTQHQRSTADEAPVPFAQHQRNPVDDRAPAQFAQHQRSTVDGAQTPAQFAQHQRSTVDGAQTPAQFAHHQHTAIDDEDQSDESPVKSDDYDSHTNFARAIAERPKSAGNGSDAAISVVLRTSSVSSSISSKPQSAITNSTTHPLSSANVLHQPYGAVGQKTAIGHHNFVSTLRSNALGATSSMRPNITEINEALTEEPYYEEGDEGANIEYDENSPEYKDIAYPSDVRKIRQR